MTLEKAVQAWGGFVVLLGLGLGHWVHPGWLWLSAFAGFMLFQSAFTGLCPATAIFRRLGLRPGGGCAA